MTGRPRTAIGTYGDITTRRRGGRVVAEARIRDTDGRLRQVRVTGRTAAQARSTLKQRLLDRPDHRSAGVLKPESSFTKLADLWLADLEDRELAGSTKEGYRDQLRIHVRPAFEHYTLSEITTGRVEQFLREQALGGYSRAKQSRTLLNLLFGYALRHDAISRNPVQGTSNLSRPKSTPKALGLEQIMAIRKAAATWRTQPGVPGPKNDGQIRDMLEVLLGTGMRPGEALALRPCDVTDGPGGMVVRVSGTVIQPKGQGAIRQDHPKTHASIRTVPVPPFAADVLRRRLQGIPAADAKRTIFATKSGHPITPNNARRTFREMLALAGLSHTGISLRWYRRTAATVIARSMSAEAAATFLGHTSTVITEGHYIAPDPTIDHTPATHLERTLRPEDPEPGLLDATATASEEAVLEVLDEPDL